MGEVPLEISPFTLGLKASSGAPLPRSRVRSCCEFQGSELFDYRQIDLNPGVSFIWGT